MKTSLAIAIIIFSINYSWAESAIFDYDDFGPQVLAYETIGSQWYQWNSTGGSDPNDIDTIKVVIYWDEPLDVIKDKYPVEPRRKKDYRYLSYESAMKYIDSTIAKYPDRANLINTRHKLIKLKNE
jgi:hypothetical protein